MLEDTMLVLPSFSPSTADNGSIGDHVVIDGVSIGLDEIVNSAIFTPQTVKNLNKAFLAAKPFPYLVLDGLINPRLLELMLVDFERLNWNDWRRHDNVNEFKRGSAPNTRFGNASQLYFDTVYSGRFVEFMENVTGIEGLITDPALYSGGLHDIPTGGKFAAHIDFNQHRVTRLDNRLVFITYLNKNWRPEYGGELELWDMDKDEPSVRVIPEFGRSVVFLQSSKSLHGHPTPVNAPDGRHRRSAATYFYSNVGTAKAGEAYHPTQFGKTVSLVQKQEKLKNTLKYFTPPVLIDVVRKLASARHPSKTNR
ncbi:2OG-Fe(II) oxygenase [Beijerinckia indica]|uniref:Prolyl 4-hydroxylase alpha subunit Fe(2+) 2OG dioxygenase domain-containing protein n=1 Tax=Beijerinckia indica subsp. indica (strain ATCC 9039 / DSM 1715 / NCIMB 8712) TaxID=395963 RepID=B2ILK5_BEII9|nr:2OG-Fe(II) oxygenase [Beijerinckia indica]ACB97405.1 conserved hypothetical protein [Beijerinckia indica subsp. indica ATCC 9039]